MTGPPDLSPPLDDQRLLEAVAYYARRASLVNANGTNRQALRRLLRDNDLAVAQLLASGRHENAAEVCEAAELTAERAATLLLLLQPWALLGEQTQHTAAELTLELAKLGAALNLARLTA